MNKIKSLVAGMAAAVLAIVLIACGGQKQETTDTPTGQPEGGAITGGWTIPEEYGTTFTDDELAIFDSAMGGLVGVDYKPVTVIATQVEAGTNRAYLCRGTLVTPEGGECWYVVTIYTNLEGKSEILDIKELDSPWATPTLPSRSWARRSSPEPTTASSPTASRSRPTRRARSISSRSTSASTATPRSRAWGSSTSRPTSRADRN